MLRIASFPLFAALALPAAAETYHVDAVTGSDLASGTAPDRAWATVARVNAASLLPGDGVAFSRGQTWDEDLDVDSDGLPAEPITYGAYGVGTPPVLRSVTARGSHSIFEDFIVDHQFRESDAFRLRDSPLGCWLRRLEIRNGRGHGVSAADADELLITDCHVHHFLAGSREDPQDAHGIVCTDMQNLVIRGCDVHHVSGDCFQTDPDRGPNKPSRIRIESSHLWTGPLDRDYAGWRAGQTPGSNAVETKVADTDWLTASRADFVIWNVVASGFVADDFIENRAVFNLQEKVNVTFDGVNVSHSEIAFRIGGTRGNADTAIYNAIVSDCDVAIRAEFGLSNLAVLNSTFGAGLGATIVHFDGSWNTDSWDLRNNAFLDPLPAEAADPSNRRAEASDFVDLAGADYHLSDNSALEDTGEYVGVVFQDRDGLGRPQGAAQDVGAHEVQADDCPDPIDPTEPVFATSRVGRTVRLSWAHTAGAYDIIRGDLDSLHAERAVRKVTCLFYAWVDSTFDDETAHQPRVYYLVRGKSWCSRGGSYGADSLGTLRRPIVDCP